MWGCLGQLRCYTVSWCGLMAWVVSSPRGLSECLEKLHSVIEEEEVPYGGLGEVFH